MKTFLVSIAFLFLAVIMAFPQSADMASSTSAGSGAQVVNSIGGNSIDFTLPDTNFLEVSERYSSMFNMFVPENNRLVCGFLTKSDVRKLDNGKDPEMDSYILVEVSKEAEYKILKPKDFKEVKSSVGDITSHMDKVGEDAMKEVNDRLKTLNIGEIQLNEPVDLGVLLDKDDAVASGMIYKVQQGESVTPYIASILLMRLKDRLVFVYLYKKYVDQSTVKEIVALTDKYSTALLSANPPARTDFITNFWDGLPRWARSGLIGGALALLYTLFQTISRTKKVEEKVAPSNVEETTGETDSTSDDTIEKSE